MGTHAIKILLEIYFVKDNLCLYSNRQKALEISIYLGIKIQCTSKKSYLVYGKYYLREKCKRHFVKYLRFRFPRDQNN